MGKRKRGAEIEPEASGTQMAWILDFLRGTEADEIRKSVELRSYKDELYDKGRQNVEPSREEFEELDRAMGRLSYHVEQLLVRFQWLAHIDLKEVLNQRLLPRNNVNMYRTLVASHIVQQYWKDNLPILDAVVSPRRHVPFQGTHTVAGGLTVERLDALQAFLIETTENSIEALRQRVQGDSTFFKRSSQALEQLRASAHQKADRRTQSSSHDEAAKSQHDDPAAKAAQDKTSWPPKLPEISDPQLVNQVFTHKSAIVDASLSSESELLHTHNERLEFKGDSILDFVICDLLYNTFPNDSEGSLSIKKASLVCNDTLFDLSVEYKLHERLNMSTDLHSKVFTSKSDRIPDASVKNKALADVFEAYIAGVALNKGLAVVQDWLIKLYTPLINDLKEVKTNDGTDKNAKNELYSKVGSATQPINYVTINEDSPFTVACVIGHEEVTRGTDRTVKLAGLRAAEAALRDPALVRRFAMERSKVPKTAPDTGH